MATYAGRGRRRGEERQASTGRARVQGTGPTGFGVGLGVNSRSVDAATVSRLYEKDLDAVARPAQSRRMRRIISDENGEGVAVGRWWRSRLNWIWLWLENSN